MPPMTNFPNFKGSLEHVKSGSPEGEWHINSNHGDGHMIVADGKFRFVRNTFDPGSPILQGGAYAEKDDNQDPFNGWPEVAGGLSDPEIAIPWGEHVTNNLGVDTLILLQNKTGKYTCLYSAVPGEAGEYQGNKWTAQRATADTPTTDSSGWTRYSGEQVIQADAAAPWSESYAENSTPPIEYDGGCNEHSAFYDPDLDAVVVFFGTKHDEPGSPQFGRTIKFRLGRAECPADEWDDTPSTSTVWTPDPAEDSYVWSPSEHGMKPDEVYGATNETAVWGTGHSTIQWNVSRNPWDGSYHMVGLGVKPNTSQGAQNLTQGIGHWWSLDKGYTWQADSRNPLFTWDTLGFTNLAVANKINSPFMLWHEQARKAWLMFWANDDGAYQTGNKLYGIELALPTGGTSAVSIGSRPLAREVLRRRRIWEFPPGGKVTSHQTEKRGILLPNGGSISITPTGGRGIFKGSEVTTHPRGKRPVLEPTGVTSKPTGTRGVLKPKEKPPRIGTKSPFQRRHPGPGEIGTRRLLPTPKPRGRGRGKPRGGPKKKLREERRR